MANLETLELTINANAESAKQGIDKLITSLSALSDALIKPYSDLRDFNKELKTLADLTRSLKLPNIAKLTGARSVVARAKQIKPSDYDPKTAGNRAVDVSKMKFPNAKSETDWQREYQKNLADYAAAKQKIRDGVAQGEARREATRLAALESEKAAIKATKEEMDSRGEVAKTIIENANAADLLKLKYDSLKQSTIDDARAGKLSNEQLVQRTFQLRKLEEQIAETNKSSEQTGNALGKLKEGFSKFTSGITGIFSKIKRIATTMLIRSAIRALIKDIKEGVTNVTEWSRTVNGSLAKAMDSFNAKTLTLKNSLGAMLSPIIQALIPMLNSLSNAIINVVNWLNQFIALLTGQTSWTHATEQAATATDGLGNSASNAGKAAKEAIAAFDELNVLTNQDTTGGGGGGGTTTQDYSGMFEQLNNFDKKIREITDFLKNNFESIKGIAIAIGSAILGWKLGSAFAETLPILSKIFGFVATGAVIAITLQANWMLANEYLQSGKEGWFWASVLTTAVGSTAAWAIANKLIGGKAGIYSAALTLLLSAATDIKANIENTDVSALDEKSIKQTIKAAVEAATGIGLIAAASGASVVGTIVAASGGALLTFGFALALKLETQKNRITWGNIRLTADQIKEYVQDVMFTSGTTVFINQVNTIIDEKLDIEKSISDALGLIDSELDILKLGVDTQSSYNRIKELISGTDGTGGLVKDIQDLCDINVDLLKLNVSQVTAYDASGNVISSEMLLSGVAGWNAVKAEMEFNGQELTKLLYKGATEQLTPEEEKYAQELLEKIMNTSRKITNAKEFSEAAVNFKTAALGAMSKGSVEGIVEAFKTYSDSNEETIRKGWLQVAQGYIELADIENDPELKAQYQQMADDIIGGLDETVARELQERNQPGIDLVKEWLENNVSISNLSGLDYWIDVLKEKGFTADNLSLALKQLMLNNGVPQITIEAMSMIGFTGWEVLEKSVKQKIINSLGGLTDSAVVKALKEELKLNVPDIIELAEWDKFTRDEKFAFLKALTDAFGAREALNAAKNAGLNIGALVSEGMGSKDPEIRKMAKNWDKIISDETKTPHQVSVTGSESQVKNVAKSFNGWFGGALTKSYEVGVNGVKSTVESVAQTISNWFSGKLTKSYTIGVEGKKTGKDGGAENAATDINNWFSNIFKNSYNVKTGVDSKSLTDAGQDVTDEFGKKRLVKIKTDADNITSAANAVGVEFAKAMIAKMKTLRIKITGNNITITQDTKAMGGFVKTGEMFIAREAGPELVGTIGNQTAVANNDQIVEGIANGVASANAEQNALLRQQNELLRGILQKSGNVTIGASSALGRVVNQSLEMYGVMTGV